MKHLKIFYTCILIFFIFSQIKAQNHTFNFKFNTIDYFSPSSPSITASFEVYKSNSYITIDINLKFIKIITYFSNDPVESIYTIKRISGLQSSKDEGQFYIIECLASNYATAIIYVDKDSEWIKRIIAHNGIYHKYYNVSN